MAPVSAFFFSGRFSRASSTAPCLMLKMWLVIRLSPAPLI
jgi:hypothetical protein